MLKSYEVTCEMAHGGFLYFPSFGRSPKQAIDRAKLSPQAKDNGPIVRYGIHKTISGSGTWQDPYQSRIHWHN